MDVNEILNIALPIVFLIVGVVLVWFLVELVLTLKTARKTVDSIQEQLTPTLEHVEKITKELEPAMTKVDPLMERVSLTVDAANLELMRVDQILEDLGDVTGTVSKATNAVDTVASAPVNLVSNVTEKVRGVLKGSSSSSESAKLAHAHAEAQLGEGDVQAAAEAAQGEAEEVQYFTYGASQDAGKEAAADDPVKEAVEATIEHAEETVAEKQAEAEAAEGKTDKAEAASN